MNRLIQLINSLSDWLVKFSGVVLGLITVLILVEISLWNIFQATTLIADEYSAYGLAAIIFLGAGYTLKEKGHIQITLVLNLLPPRLASVVNLLATAVTTAFMGYLLYYLYRMTAGTWRYGSTSGTLTATPLWVPQGVMLLGAVSFFLQLAAETLEAGQDLFSGKARQ